MDHVIYWEMAEFMGEVELLYPTLSQKFPNMRELIPDMVSLALRDFSWGTDNGLSEFIEQNLSSEFQYLGLFFKANGRRWYNEISDFVSQRTQNYDWFSIDDIVQQTPTQLLIKVVTGHYSESESECMATTASR